MTIRGKPFVKWVGGKGQLLSQIEKAFPKRLFSQERFNYIEPFVGGGAMLFYLLEKHPNIEKAVINDINTDLIISYKVVRDRPVELIDGLSEIQDEYLALDQDKRKEYYLRKRELYNTKSLDDVANTIVFMFLNRTCFNGLYRVNQKGLFNVPFGSYVRPRILDKELILKDSELLQKVEILNVDYSNTIEFANSNTFYYLDPPYRPITATSSFNSYNKTAFNDDEQIRLKEFCDKIASKGSHFLLSNSDPRAGDSDDSFFDDLYSDFNIQRVLASRFINSNPAKRGKLTELLIGNYKGARASGNKRVSKSSN